jgi:hypothetical protein
LETKRGDKGQKIGLGAAKLVNHWRARRDLNPQPSDPKSA